jgi:hypothetical protein
MRTSNRPTIALFAIAMALGLAALAPGAAAQNGVGGAAVPGGGDSSGQSTGSTGASSSSTAASSARSTSHGPAPIITAASCYAIGRTHCQRKHRHAVEMTGELVIHGHHFAGQLTVYFQGSDASAARVDPIGAPLRPTPHGFSVTVPLGATSGRIYLESRGGKRSNFYGPVKITEPPITAVAAPAPSATAFNGAGMWIWYLDQSDGGNLAAIAAQAKAAGITTLYIKSSDGDDFWAQFTPTMIQTLHALGLNVCAWQYVYGADPAGEAAMGAEAVADGADCLAIDAESSYEGRYWAAQTYISDLRAVIGASYPLGLASFPYVNEHPELPYSVFLGPGGAQFDLPQVYWKDIGTTPDAAYAQTFIENRIYDRPIVPIGQSYNNVAASQITRFRQLASAYGALGFSLYSWQATNTAGWQALDAPFTPATGVVVPTSWPTLAEGKTGDQVLWMQEHLAAHDR